MYIIDLFVNIFKGKRFASLFWISLNAVVIVFSVALFVEAIGQGRLETWLTLVIAGAVYLLSLLAALSPIGEALLRWQNGCKRITDSKILERIEPLFNEVFETAAKNNPALNRKIEIFICDEESPNAFATGRKTICITKGLLDMNDYEIKGILAHEFGHIEHKDTDILLIVAVGNMLVSIILTVVGLIIRGFNWVASFFGSLALGEKGAFILGFLTSKLNLLVSMLFGAIAWVWTKLGFLICIRSARNQEYSADKYAHEIGFGNQLRTSLEHLAHLEPKKSKSIWAMISATHPETSLRVEKLDSYGAVEKTGFYAASVTANSVQPVSAPISAAAPTPVFEESEESYCTPPVMMTRMTEVKRPPMEDIRSYSNGYYSKSSTAYSMIYHKFFKAFGLPVVILLALANLHYQAKEIIYSGISMGNVLFTVVSFASIIVSSVAIYMLSKEIKGATSFAAVAALLHSATIIADAVIIADTASDPLRIAIFLILSVGFSIAFSAISISYYSKRKKLFTKSS